MEYRKLGRTDIKVSAICLGTMTWGEQNTEEQGHEQMDYAVNQGINFFDTAELYAVPPSAPTYTLTETYIGNWFAKTGKRKDIILASKVAGIGPAWIHDGMPINKRKIDLALEGSLKRLQTDYLDLYQLHWPNRTFPHMGRWGKDIAPHDNDTNAQVDNFMEILETLKGYVQDGKIRHIGLSNDTPWGAMKYLQLAEANDLPRIQTIQNEYSLVYRGYEDGLSEVTAYEDVGLLAYSPLSGGALSGKYLDGKIPDGTRRSVDTRPQHRQTDAADSAIRAYMKLAAEHGLDVCQMANQFVTTRPFVTSNIIGATSMEQLKSNIDSINVTLSDDVLQSIDDIFRQYPRVY